MPGEHRWRTNWTVIAPRDAAPVVLARSASARRAERDRVRSLPPGSAVVLFAAAPGAIRRCRSFAAEAGITVESEYLALPSATTPAYLVEDAPASVRVFVRTVLVAPPDSALATVIDAGLVLVRALNPWRLIRTVAPGRVVVGRRVGGAPREASSMLERLVGGRGHASAEPVPLDDFVRTSGFQSIVVGASKDPNAKVTILLVSPERARPVLAVKVPTTDVAAGAVAAERRALVALAGVERAALGETVPRVVDAVEFRGRRGIVMTAVQGIPMTTTYFRLRHTASRSRVAADFAAVEAWLAALHEETSGKRGPLDVHADVDARLRERFHGDGALATDLDRLAEIRAVLRGETTPRTAVHGDFWLGNVLLEHGRVSGVVDWESGAVAGDPVRDLARFALMYALYLDRRTKGGRRVQGHGGLRAGTGGAAVEFALDGVGWFPELFRAFLGHGLERLGASPTRWRDVAVAGIAEVAALTDHEEFARRHLELFRRVAR